MCFFRRLLRRGKQRAFSLDVDLPYFDLNFKLDLVCQESMLETSVRDKLLPSVQFDLDDCIQALSGFDLRESMYTLNARSFSQSSVSVVVSGGLAETRLRVECPWMSCSTVF